MCIPSFWLPGSVLGVVVPRVSDIFAPKDPKIQDGHVKINRRLALPLYQAMLQKPSLTFVNSVTFKIKAMTRKATGFLRSYGEVIK